MNRRRFALARGRAVTDILFLATDEDLHYAFHKDGTYSSDTLNNMSSAAERQRYDLDDLCKLAVDQKLCQ
jgi:hypothetical protein